MTTPTLTPEEVRRGAALNRRHMLLGREVGEVARMEEYLKRVPVDQRPPDWEARAKAIREKRDEAQTALDEAYREMPGNPGFSSSILLAVLQARLAHWGTLEWVATVERLGGPKARTVLARVKEIERVGVGGDETLGEDCPVVRAMQTQDRNPGAFRRRRARRGGGGVNPDPGRGLERDTGAGT